MIYLIVWMHFIADFVLQSSWMAKHKSTSSTALSWHILVYTLAFTPLGLKYALLNGILHWIVDYNTSRLTSYLWKQKEVHWFFVVIGFDQAVHMTCLLQTMGLMR